MLVFDRNPVTGALVQKAGTAGYISETGSGGDCFDGVALASVDDTVVSPDGNNVYAASLSSSAIVIFDRAANGSLTQKAGTAGCISNDGTGGACADGVAMVGVGGLVVSPDGRNVYAIAGLTGASLSVTIFDRNLANGELTQKAGTAGCISNSGTGGACQDGRGMVSPRGIDIAPDGSALYVSMEDSDGIAIFDRDPATGELTQRYGDQGCANRFGTEFCALTTATMNTSVGLVASPDDENIYVSSYDRNGVTIFDRLDVCPVPPSTTTTTTTTTTLPPIGSCPASPRMDCADMFGKARLTMRDGDGSDRIEFVWKRGESSQFTDFGDPTDGSTIYTLCVWDNGSPVAELVVPPGGSCGSRSCWRSSGSKRHVYFDADTASDGVRSIVLKSSSVNRTKIVWTALSDTLLLPVMPVVEPLSAQVIATTGATVACWGTDFDAVRTNKDLKVEAIQR